MNASRNPFARGFRGLAISRRVFIARSGFPSFFFRRLHSSQADLPDDEIQSRRCIYNDDFAAIVNDQRVDTGLTDLCRGSGTVVMISYSIIADDFGTPVHVGDTDALSAARTVIHRLSFEPGHYSSCWEISSKHLPASALNALEFFTEIATPPELLFQAFRMPGQGGICIKFFIPQWIVPSLIPSGLSAVDEMRQRHIRLGLPSELVQLLYLAALADTRILIIEHDAPVLAGLPVF